MIMSEETKAPKNQKGWVIPLFVAIIVILIAILAFQSCGGPSVLNNSKQTTVQTQPPKSTPAPTNGFQAPPVNQITKIDGKYLLSSGDRAYMYTGKGITETVRVTLAPDEAILISALRLNGESYFGQIRIFTKSGDYVITDGDIGIYSKKGDLKDRLILKFGEFKGNPTWALSRIDTLSDVNPKDFVNTDNKKVEVITIN
jgi:hypothetical protein